MIRSYLNEVSLPSLTTFPLSSLNEILGYSSLTKMDVPPLDWELEEMFGSWNSAIWAIEDLVQVAGNHRATMILNKAFLHCEDFLHWAYKPNLPATFLLALDIEFKRGLYISMMKALTLMSTMICLSHSRKLLTSMW